MDRVLQDGGCLGGPENPWRSCEEAVEQLDSLLPYQVFLVCSLSGDKYPLHIFVPLLACEVSWPAFSGEVSQVVWSESCSNESSFSFFE